MAVNTAHPDFDANYPRWRRCRDAYGGTDTVKQAVLRTAAVAAGQPAYVIGHRTQRHAEIYLPKLEGMDWTQYSAYVERALWYGATKRTIEGLSGAIFRKDPTVEVPDKIKAQLDDITMDGDVTLAEFAKKLLREVLITGRVGGLVDMAADDVGPADRRPYWVLYTAEQIINWKTRRIGGKTVLSLVVIEEHVPLDTEDEFEQEQQEQYRVLKLDDPDHTGAGVYTVEIWTEVVKQGQDDANEDTAEFELSQRYVPMNVGKPLTFIPFCFFGAEGLNVGIDAPPLIDLVDVNFSHYRSTADYEHGLHYTALPTPYALGFPESSSLMIGPASAWISPNPEAKVGMLEFTGQGLKPLGDAIKEKEAKMAALGARLLEAQKAGVEAADTVKLRQSGEHGALQSMASTISQGLTKMAGWHADWTGQGAAKADVAVNKDFYDVDINPALLQMLIGALQSGSMSFETFYYNLEKRDLTRPGVTADEERALIDAGSAEFKTMAPGGPDDKNEEPIKPPEEPPEEPPAKPPKEPADGGSR